MIIQSFSAFDLNKRSSITPGEILTQMYSQTNLVIKLLNEIKPNSTADYIQALITRLNFIIQSKEIKLPNYAISKFCDGHEYLENKECVQKIYLFIASELNTDGFRRNPDQVIKPLWINEQKAREILSYLRVKSLIDIFGKETGVEIWKQIVAKIADLMVPNKPELPVRKSRENTIDYWNQTNIGDFTAAFINDHSVLYRFDRCIIHEALKALNDPEIAYLSSCYVGAVIGSHPQKTVRMRRTQTLHTSSFCDEFYWDFDVLGEVEQPSLSFTKNLK